MFIIGAAGSRYAGLVLVGKCAVEVEAVGGCGRKSRLNDKEHGKVLKEGGVTFCDGLSAEDMLSVVHDHNFRSNRSRFILL